MKVNNAHTDRFRWFRRAVIAVLICSLVLLSVLELIIISNLFGNRSGTYDWKDAASGAFAIAASIALHTLILKVSYWAEKSSRPR